MAENNPQFANESAPNWTGVSRGSTPDTSGSDLFKGITDAVEMGFKAADKFISGTIKDEATASVDQIQNKYGSQPFTNDEAIKTLTNDPSVPLEARRQAERASRMQKSYANGELTESRYWAELDNTARQLRARYPAYREQIDQTMSHLTGAIPANRLIQEVRQEQMKVDREAGKYDTYVNHIAGKKEVGGLPADFFSRKDAGNPYTMDELRAYESTRMNMWYKVEKAKAQYDLDVSQGKVDKEQAFQAANVAFSTSRYTLVENAAGGPTGYNKMIETFEKAGKDQSGGVISPETEKQLYATIASTRAKADAEFNLQLTQKDSNGRSWDDRLDPEMKKKLRDDHKAFWDDITEAATNKQWGYLGSRLRYMEGRQRDDRIEFESSGVVRAQAAMKNSLGPEAVSWYLARKGDLVMPELDKTMTEFVRTNTLQKAAEDAARGRYDTKFNLDKAYNDLITKGVKPAQAYKTILDDHLKIVTDPDAPASLKKGALLTLYGPSNAAFIKRITEDGGERQTTFLRMTGPQITRAIKDTGDERLMQNYVRWTNDTLIGMNTSILGSFAAGSVIDNSVHVRYNTESNQFEVLPRSTITLPGQVDRRGAAQAETDARVRRAQGLIDELNGQIKSVLPIWKESGDVIKQVQNFVRAADLPFSVPSPEKTPSGKDNTRVITGGSGDSPRGDAGNDTLDTPSPAGPSSDFSNDLTRLIKVLQGEDPRTGVEKIAQSANDLQHTLYQSGVTEKLMTAAERADPEEQDAIKYEFAPGSPVYGIYSRRLEKKVDDTIKKIDRINDPTPEEEAQREAAIEIKKSLEAKKENFYRAYDRGNHQAIMAREPSWSVKGSQLEKTQDQYIKDNNIPAGQTIAKRFAEIEAKKEAALKKKEEEILRQRNERRK